MPLTTLEQRAVKQELTQPRYEIIPMKGVDEQLAHIPDNSTVSVTCSPSRGLEVTLAVSEKVKRLGGNRKVVPHLAARMIESSAQLDTILTRMMAANIRSAFVVGGDAIEESGRPYPSSLQLALAIRDRDSEIELGSTAYPEGHPTIPPEVLVDDVLAKQPYVSYVVTQMCFNPSAITDWLEHMQQQNMKVPVIVGVPGVVNRTDLVRIGARVGVGESLKFLTKNPKTVLKQFPNQTERQTNLIMALAPQLADLEHPISGFHIYSFNQIQSTETWRKQYLASG